MYRKITFVATSLIFGIAITFTLFFLLTATSTRALASSSVLYVAPGANCNGASPCYSNIQDAVDIALYGDEIRVAAGTYTGVDTRLGEIQVVYISETVDIRGGYNISDWNTSDLTANPTILDAQGLGRVVTVIGNITPTIESLKMTDGYAEHGGGIYVLGANATISNCVIYSNTAHSSSWGVGGGGVYIESSPSRLTASTIMSNTAYRGGGVYLWESDNALLDYNIVDNNTAIYWAGGLYLHFSGATIKDNTIQNNIAEIDGAGIGLQTSYAYIVNNLVMGNNTPGSGGGISSWQGDTSELVGNTIIDNSSKWGGGVDLFESLGASLDGNTIIGNYAQSAGGGIWIYDSQAITLTNNIIADNSTDGNGAGIYVGGSEAYFYHTTIADNTGGDESGVYLEDTSSYFSTAELVNSILVNHITGVRVLSGNSASLNSTLWNGNMNNWGGSGSINHINDYTGDPVFIDAVGWDYHIRHRGAAVDKGINAGHTVDIDGQSRPLGNGFELGADEVIPANYLYIPLTAKIY